MRIVVRVVFVYYSWIIITTIGISTFSIASYFSKYCFRKFIITGAFTLKPKSSEFCSKYDYVTCRFCFVVRYIRTETANTLFFNTQFIEQKTNLPNEFVVCVCVTELCAEIPVTFSTFAAVQCWRHSEEGRNGCLPRSDFKPRLKPEFRSFDPRFLGERGCQYID